MSNNTARQQTEARTPIHSTPDLKAVAHASGAKLAISRNWLLGIYGVIPLCALAIAIDQLLLSGALRASLPYSPENMLLFSAFFVLPHIFASTIEFFDREYVSHYKKRLSIGLPVIVVGTAVLPMLIGRDLFLMFFGIYTIYHVIGQQFGLVKMGLSKIGGLYNAWKWLGILVGFLVYAAVYPPDEPPFDFVNVLPIAAAVLCVPWTYLAWRVSGTARTRRDAWGVWANQLMVVFALGAFVMGYPFFVVLVPRLVHDVTAFSFYAVHDRNRNHGTSSRPNLFFRFFPRGVSGVVLSPLLGVLTALPLTIYQNDFALGWYFVIGISIFHYFTERFVWKAGTPHRAQVKFI